MLSFINDTLCKVSDKIRVKRDPLEEYKEEIKEAKDMIKYYERKYNMSSEDFIAKRYSRSCTQVEAADANNWATLYLTIGKMVP